MAEIHNNPELEDGPRMPFIVPSGLRDLWLKPYNDRLDKEYFLELIRPYPSEEMTAHRVQPIRGKASLGNVPEAMIEIL